MIHPVYLFFDIGGGEIILIMIVALLLFGGDKLPELAKGLGKGIRDFKDASEGVKREIQNQINTYDDKKTEDEKPAEQPVTETPVAEHKEEEITHHEPQIAPNHVPNTMAVGESQAVANDDPDFVNKMIEEKRAEDMKILEQPAAIEPKKEQHS